MALTCPQCATSMQEVRAEATPGYFILLDQCPRCGGIWCDRWELYPITATAAARIDTVDRDALQQLIAPVTQRLECPRCRARMRPLHDPVLACDAHIERCPNCDGLWLNRGELRGFKNHTAAASPSPRRAPTEVDRLAVSVCPQPKAWPTVRSIGAALDPATETAAPPFELGPQIMRAAAWVVARAALRLLLHV